jgi:hypothetical protein
MQAETLFKDTVIDLGPDVKRPFLWISWNIHHVANTNQADSSILKCQLRKYQPTRRNIPEDLNRKEGCENLKPRIFQVNPICRRRPTSDVLYQSMVQGLSFIVATGTAALSHRQPASTGTSCDRRDVQDSDKRNGLYYEPSHTHQFD